MEVVGKGCAVGSMAGGGVGSIFVGRCNYGIAVSSVACSGSNGHVI